MTTEAIILAGGLGTRLRGTVPDLPKCLAPVAGRPFLFYVINYLRSQGITDFIFSLGHKHEHIESYLDEEFPSLHFQVVVEHEPLGTGGAIALALQAAQTENVIVANGDTLFKINLEDLYHKHVSKQAVCTLALKPMSEFSRYGSVELDKNDKVTHFNEKKYYEKGLINGGIYLLNKPAFDKNKFPEKFSFEQDFLEKQESGLYGYKEDAYFIDIGIPEDYQRAQEELQQPPLDLKKIDNSWTLFIDRDGVINYEKKDDYIRNKGEFRFYENFPEDFAHLESKFGKIFIVSNQRGVGKFLMTEDDLDTIHEHMLNELRNAGGKVDGIYFCTAVSEKDPDRKPNPGMAFRASHEFPGIDLAKSIMVGNKPSDMKFGKNAGMYTVYLATTHPETKFPHPDIDYRFSSFGEFVKAL